MEGLYQVPLDGFGIEDFGGCGVVHAGVKGVSSEHIKPIFEISANMNGADKRAALEGTAPAFGVKLLSNISVDEAEKDIVERGVVTVDKYFITIEFNFGKVGVIKARWDVGIDSEWFEIEKRVIENPTGPIGQVDEHGAVGGFAGVMHGCNRSTRVKPQCTRERKNGVAVLPASTAGAEG